MNIFPVAPSDLAAASSQQLQRFIAECELVVDRIMDDPNALLTDDFTMGDLVAAMEAGVATMATVREELARKEAEEPPVEGEEEGETDEEASPSEPEGTAAVEDAESLTPKLEELAALARSESEPAPDEGDGGEEGDPAPDEGEPESATATGAAVAVVAASEPPALKPIRRLPKPSSERVGTVSQQLQPLVAAADGLGPHLGEAIDSEEIAKMMVKARRDFGTIAEGTETKVPIARADWSDSYGPERTLTADADINWDRINQVIDTELIKMEMSRRKTEALTASGGLCAPVTPYYQLQMISQSMRPVRAALPSFNADRGGLRFARPAALSAVTTAVGVRTAANDFAGGTEGAKTCQVIPCPPFSEVDVSIIYHCLQFGNLGARTFPELVAQWNSLVLAAHARTAETLLLDGIAAASTAITASNNALGASASLLGQILTAANALRSRHRMDPNAVLRVLLPEWSMDLLLSDIMRSQYQRFDQTEAGLTALLRTFDVEPTFYLDSATGAGQVYGAQAAGALLSFPTSLVWYMFPEGSFLYLDGGTLELGLVRDSTLNRTNDFQIFGESFENVAFVGIESYAVTSTVCDSGQVALPVTSECPQVY